MNSTISKLKEFLQENKDELENLVAYSSYNNICAEFIVAEEDMKASKGKLQIKGPDYQLLQILKELVYILPYELDRYMNDKRNQRQKYKDSLNKEN